MKKHLAFFLAIFTLLSLFAIPAAADMGPKPSVTITFENLGDELCYATLLSKKEYDGPHAAWNGTEEGKYYYGDDDRIWKAFVNYKDSDGFYYLQIDSRIDETKEFHWGYYPPSPFKILLYFPESGRFAVSGIYERYAFDSYFTVDMEGINIGSVTPDGETETNALLQANKSYQYGDELWSLCVRILATVIIEMLIAFLFKFREKKQFLFLVGVNCGTQIVLNVLLNLVNYKSGYLAFVATYIELELLVFVAEAVLYCIFMNRLTEKKHKPGFYILYALVANGISFAIGMLAAQVIPGIF